MLSIVNEKGQGLVEYALILVLIALVVFIAVDLLGQGLDNTFEMISNRLGEL